jgi:hypothetical protein
MQAESLEIRFKRFLYTTIHSPLRILPRPLMRTSLLARLWTLLKSTWEDVEGKVLKGMRRLLCEARPVVLVEFYNEAG